MKIYHFVTKPDWEKAKKEDTYSPPFLSSEGFIHNSTRKQVIPTANRIYNNHSDLLLLTIETDLLDQKLVFDVSSKNGEKYPHIYGPLNISAVENVQEFPSNENGVFDDNEELIRE